MMRFNPQGNMVSVEPSHSRKQRGPSGGLRAGVLIVIIAVAGAFGTWIYKQADLGPAGAAASSIPGSGGGTPVWGSTERAAPAATARRSDMNHSAVRRPTEGAASSTSAAPGKSAAKTSADDVKPIVIKDSKRRYAVAAYADGQKALSAGLYTQAIVLLEKAIELDPAFSDAHYALGLAHIMSGNRHAAIDQLRRLREMDENLANLLANLLQ